MSSSDALTSESADPEQSIGSCGGLLTQVPGLRHLGWPMAQDQTIESLHHLDGRATMMKKNIELAHTCSAKIGLMNAK